MKKLIAVTIVAVMMLALGATSFALVADSTASKKDAPVTLSAMTVSDAWMSGLTAQNWTGALTQQAYAANQYIWFIAKISVAGAGATVADHLWTGNGEEATLTITSQDNCLNFSSANMATLAKINGMTVVARQIQNNNLGIVEALANKVTYTFKSVRAAGVDTANGAAVVYFDDNNLSGLGLDGIYNENTLLWNNDLAAATEVDQYGNDATGLNTGVANRRVHRATAQKDFYLHFMAITNSATEGVCLGTLKVNGEDEFKRENNGRIAVYSPTPEVGAATPTLYTQAGTWYDWATYTSGGTTGSYNNQVNWNAEGNDAQLLPGDRSIPVLLYNTYNDMEYAIAKISGESYNNLNAVAPDGYQDWRGPYGNDGSIYILMTKDCATFKVGFAVSSTAFRGLVTWNDDWRDGTNLVDARKGGKAGKFNFMTNPKTWNAAYYLPLMSNDVSAGTDLVSAYRDKYMSVSELEAIFNFFNFAYSNPRKPTDADFLAKSGLYSSAEARYNVAAAVVTTPDTSVVIPQTGDAATSTGLILIASAILAAAAVGFILSKRAYN